MTRVGDFDSFSLCALLYALCDLNEIMAHWEDEIRSLTGKAIRRYGMIEDGDRILVGVSGGKDSLTLLTLLHEREETGVRPLRCDPRLYQPGLRLGTGEGAGENFLRSGISRTTSNRRTLGKKAHSAENRENPCFLCSWERRKRIFHLAHRLNCNKIALGHHKDDIIETFLLNIFYSAEDQHDAPRSNAV